MSDLVDLPAGFVLRSETIPWTLVGTVDSVPVDRGVAVLVDHVPVALFRLAPIGGGSEAGTEEWHAVDHVDPQNQAPVMARGLVGSHIVGEVLHTTVSSPLDKRRYDLVTGRCLDGESAPLRVFEVVVTADLVLVR